MTEDTGGDFFERLLSRMRIELSETAKAALLCFECGSLTEASYGDDVVGDVLTGQPPRCSQCSEPLDIWKLLVAGMTVGRGLAFGLPTGVRCTQIFYRLPIGTTTELVLAAEGVPEDAQLLWVAHRTRPEGQAIIVDLGATDSSRPPMQQYVVTGLWNSPQPAPADVQGQTTVFWAVHDADDVGRQLLVHALESVTNHRSRDAIVPANVAVESTLTRVVEDYVEWIGVGKDRRRSFLRDAATFSHQLNVLSPAIARHLSAPALPAHVRGALNRLRELRNDAAHAGVRELDRTELGTCLAAAIVGFRYARLLGECLEATRNAG
jgi:hypothetical protein